MPIENEFSYVLLDDACELQEKLRRRKGIVIERIHQGYLSKGVRLRRTEDMDSEALKWHLTFKREVGGHVVEIETEISSDDFEALWPTCETFLSKTRYKFDEDGLHWDVDYFGKLNRHYFVKAEAEMPKHLEKVQDAPPPCGQIFQHVLLIVGKGAGFSSRRLCDKKYAVELLNDIKAAVEKAATKAAKKKSKKSDNGEDGVVSAPSMAAA